LAIVQSPAVLFRTGSVAPSAAIASAEKKETLEPSRSAEVFRYGRKKHALGRWFHCGRLGHHQQAGVPDRRFGEVLEGIRGPEGRACGAVRWLSRRDCRDSPTTWRQAAAARRHGGIQPWLEGGALRFLSGRYRRTGEGPRLGRRKGSDRS